VQLQHSLVLRKIGAIIGANLTPAALGCNSQNQPAMTSTRNHKPKRQLATEIATAIRDGVYGSGEWLRQVDLEEKFNAKRFDVRAALAELALRKTVEHVANRGYRVAVPDINETHEMLAIRILLEVEAATLALPNIGAEQMREIEDCARAFERAISDGSIVEQSRTNDAFHDAIYRHAPNRKLVELVVEMRDRSVPGPITLWPSYDSLMRSAADHRVILSALEARDGEALAEAVRRHIAGSEPHYAHYSNDKRFD
jgi:DNA-binding GntR family transcriptional regulator